MFSCSLGPDGLMMRLVEALPDGRATAPDRLWTEARGGQATADPPVTVGLCPGQTLD